MPYSPTELEAVVRKRAPEIARDIQAAARRSRVEADLVAEVEDVLKRFEKSFGLNLRLERERTLINGRADAVYNRLVIEYEPPGSLRKEPSARTNQHAVEQVKQYMAGLERMDRQRKERLAGVVLDGSFYIFVRYREDHWHVGEPEPVSAHSTETFLRYLLSLSTELALTPENLMRDFGENTAVSRMAVPALYNALCSSATPKVQILFEQWQRLFSEICGYEEGSGKLDVGALAKMYGVVPCRAAGDASVRALALFFSIHTYYALFIKLLAVQIAHYYLMPKLGTGLAQVASSEADTLRAYLRKMERGGLFADFGIKNYLEGDFFGWYLDAWDASIEAAVRRMIGDLANYSLVTLDVDPEETRDLLKQLYQNLMPKKLRHDLGEYYTPDWLADRLLNQLGVDGNPGKRLLDPACGSGTFLVLTIKRVRQYADDKMLPPAGVLDQILQNVVGFDLNPLAVMTARTNYLLALGDLLEYRTGEISIPVYLADSIMTPSMETGEGGQLSFLGKGPEARVRQPAYSFNTAVGRFSVPRSLVDARYIDELAGLLEECVGVGLKPEQFRARLLQAFPLDAARDAAEVDVALRLYEQLLKLDHKGINGIWARIIKNAFAPLFQGRFDYVAGNPPWVNWESLPDDYRQETKPLWVLHGLFPHGGMDTILGKGKKDISMLMSYVAMDNYLKDGARLGFVITQSVFKTSGAGQGFRRFRLGSSTPVAVVTVDDMADLKPFEGATNRTAIVVLQRGRPTTYPVPYSQWYKPAGGSVIPEDLSLQEINREKIATFRQYAAQPVDNGEPTSPWITARPRVLKALKSVLGASVYQGREGANTGGANAVYWLQIVGQRPDGMLVVSNLTERAKRRVENVQAILEPGLLYPLLRGRDVARWEASPQAYTLMVQDPERRRGYSETWLSTQWPKTYAYLRQFEPELRSRSAYKRYFSEEDPFYTMFNIGDYTLAAEKVVWREVSHRLNAAVASMHDDRLIGCKCIIPDHTLILVACGDRDEAHFVCASLNSAPSRFVVQSYIVLHPDPHILDRVRVPRFDPASPTHRQLSALSLAAHTAASTGDAAHVREMEIEIDRLAAQLWGLTDAELREIQESLAELE